MDEINELIKEGAAHAGMQIQRAHDSELGGLVSLVGQARDGDVVAIMTHQDRELLDQWLVDHGASRDNAEVLRAKVRFAARRIPRLVRKRLRSLQVPAQPELALRCEIRVRHGIAEFAVVLTSGSRLRMVDLDSR